MHYKLSKKIDGNMRLGSPLSNEVLKNRTRLFQTLKLNPDSVFSADLVHGNKVAVVKPNTKTQTFKNTDALISNLQNVVLTVTVADCLPIFFYNPKNKSFGIAHAGWKGLEKNIIAKTVGALLKNFGGRSKDIEVLIGPHILPHHYEIKEDLIVKFSKYNAVKSRQNKYFLNLAKVAMGQLEALGIPKKHVKISKECTFCKKETYFSYRRDKPKHTEAQIALIYL